MKKNKFEKKIKLRRILNIYKVICLVLVGLLIFSFKAYADKTTVNIVKKEIVNPNIVMLGDSITEIYNLNEFYGEDKLIVNSGISGNRISDISNNLKSRVYAYNPSKIFLLIGINDILWDGADEKYVYDKTIEIIDHIHKKLPNTKIYVESIYPVNSEMNNHFNEVDIDKVSSTIINVNTMLKEYSDKKDFVEFIYIYDELLDENQELDMRYSDDGLHPNEEGYKLITSILKKYM